MGAKKERHQQDSISAAVEPNTTPKIALVAEPEVGPVTDPDDGLEPKLRGLRIVRKDKVYMGEDVYAKIHTLQGEYRALCLDVSPFEITLGVEIGEDVQQQVFEKVQIEIVAPQGTSLPLEGGITSIDKPGRYGNDVKPLRFAVRQQPYGDLDVARQRGAPLIELPEYLQLQASADDPLYFSEPIYFRIIGFSARGARLVASSRQGALLPGLPLKLSFFLAGKGECLLDAKILRVETDLGADTMALDVAFSQIPTDIMLGISECVLASSDRISVTDLRQWGFSLDHTDKLFNLTSPKSSKDWCRVLELRLMTIQAEDNSHEDNDIHKMLDRFDSFSRQFICKVGGQIAGSLRVVFVDRDLRRSQYASLGVVLPEVLRQEDFVEISRFAVDPDFDRQDLLIAMFTKALQLCFKTRKRYVLSHCKPELWPLYKRFGFKKTGKRFSAFGQDKCLLVLLDSEAVCNGSSGDGLLWNQLLTSELQLGDASSKLGFNLNLGRLFTRWLRR